MRRRPALAQHQFPGKKTVSDAHLICITRSVLQKLSSLRPCSIGLACIGRGNARRMYLDCYVFAKSKNIAQVFKNPPK
jgi:hypothetical protein